MKYLDILEGTIGKSKTTDNTIYNLLCCEIVRINTILDDASEKYNTTRLESDKLDKTYEYETAYKQKVIDLLTMIDNV